MAIHNEEVMEGSRGLSKTIDKSAMSMIFDNLQKHQYQYPIKSTIRELVSNAVDAVKERNIALKIIKGETTEGEHYLRRDEAMFKDSNFHPEYYNPTWMSDHNLVTILHQYSGMDETRDTLVIQDYGVGLGITPHPETGKSRLQGYFELGYSSKRNTNTSLGKFGLGAKAALSIGTDYFTMTTIHNGKCFKFNVYSYKVDSLIPKFDSFTEKINPEFVFNEGQEDEFRGYYVLTDDPNGTKIEIPTKKIHRQQIIDAVKSQLLYFDSVAFRIREEDGQYKDIDFRAEVIYEDEHLILSDNSQFSKPHLVLNGVNYGYVDFRELELEDIQGNIGLKVKPENVEINPSRESLIWNEKTRDAVLDMLGQVEKTASRMVTEKLQETDFLTWLETASSVIGKTADKNSIVGRLSNLLPATRIKPAFPGNPSIKYHSGLLEDVRLTHISVRTSYDSKLSRRVAKVEREEGVSIYTLINSPIYLQTEATSPIKDKYLAEHQSFIKLRAHDLKQGDTETNAKFKARVERADLLFQLLTESGTIKNYEDVVVPEIYLKKDAEQEEADEVASLTPAELRKLGGKMLIHRTYRNAGWNKLEYEIQEVLDMEEELIYGFGSEKSLLWMVKQLITSEDMAVNGGQRTDLHMVAQTHAKVMRKHLHINDFIRYYDHTTKTIGMHNKLVQVSTAIKIRKVLPQMFFLSKFQPFNSAMSALYSELTKYVSLHAPFEDVVMQSANHAPILEYMDKVAQLHLFIEDHPGDSEAIAAESKAIFDTEFEGAVGLDIPMYRKMEQVLEYIEPIHVLMNNLVPMSQVTPINISITSELESEIRMILKNKGVVTDN